MVDILRRPWLKLTPKHTAPTGQDGRTLRYIGTIQGVEVMRLIGASQEEIKATLSRHGIAH